MKLWRILILICILLLIVACAALLDRPAEPPPDVQPPVTVPHEIPPRPFVDPGMRIDDLDLSSLETAIERSLRYYDKTKNSSFWFGNREILVSELKASLAAFREIIRSADPDEIKMKRLQDTFDFIPSPGQDGRGTVIFTGYYVPVLEGSPVRTDRYRYPLYRKPDDLIVVNPGKRNSRNGSEPLIGRTERGELVPYYTRDEIDRHGVLGRPCASSSCGSTIRSRFIRSTCRDPEKSGCSMAARSWSATHSPTAGLSGRCHGR